MTSPLEYSAIKAGVISLTKWLARYYSGYSIRVNCVSPGGILAGQPETFLKRYRESCTGILACLQAIKLPEQYVSFYQLNQRRLMVRILLLMMVGASNGQDKQILVTGADGFIGSHLVGLLVKTGYKGKSFLYL